MFQQFGHSGRYCISFTLSSPFSCENGGVQRRLHGVGAIERQHVTLLLDRGEGSFYSQGNVFGDDMGDVGLSTGTGMPPGITAPGLRVIGERKERTSRMNRFFSKLNLQDIKIDKEGHHFPPDEDEGESKSDGRQPQMTETVEIDAPVVDQYAPARTVPAAPSYDAPVDTAVGSEVEMETTIVHDVQADIIQANGHALEETSATVEYMVDGGVAVTGEVLKVSARSRPSAVAGAIAGVVREAGRAEVQAIGAGATNQAVKAVAIARDYLSETGIDAICIPAFIDVTIENEDRTAIRLVVEPR